MAGLALVSLMMLRSMVKSIPPADPNLAFAAPKSGGRDGNESSPSERAAASATPRGSRRAAEKVRPKLRLKKGPTLKDDLTEMVREDPDGAAAILRTWIGNAG